MRVSQADLLEALKDVSREELLGMALRLTRSQQNLLESLEVEKVEQQVLREEAVKLNETIAMMMKETQKLKISKDNTTTPVIEEGAFGFLGRAWERWRPRDKAVVVNEHIGELKKNPKAVTKTGKQVETRGPQADKVLAPVDRLGEHLGNILGQGKEIGAQALESLQQKPPEPATFDERVQKRKAEIEAEKAKPAVEGYGGRWNDVGATAEGMSVRKDVPLAVPPVALDAVEPSGFELSPIAGSAGFDLVPALPAGAGAQEAPAAEASEDQISSTILIEAHVTLGDGTVQNLQVRAAERCKEVAQRFIKDHSLKPVFVDPLTSFLKKVEADAERFPVSVQADLMEIHEKFAKA